MKSWKEILISPDTSILKALEIVDNSSLQIALVVSEVGRLLGTVTDGDVRRAILRGISLKKPVNEIMFQQPTVANNYETRETIITRMKLKQLRHIPLVDQEGRVTGLHVWDELIDLPQRDNIVVLMAGGLGTRLGELTKECPKPLLRVGGKPVLETILENCKEYGFNKYFMSVNYKADMVKEYFGDGARWGVEICYLEESRRMGTAGALGLLPEIPQLPLMVVNGDVLTKVNFNHLLAFHEENRSLATMCVREYEFQIPFGVVEVDSHRLLNILEKPIHRLFVNAGIYVLNPEVLDLVPHDSYFDMPSLFETLLKEKKETSAFPVREYWLDIGRMDDFQRANNDYKEVFL